MAGLHLFKESSGKDTSESDLINATVWININKWSI